MNLRDSNKSNRSVRLFPRLSTANPPGPVTRRRGKLASRTASGISSTDPIASVRAEVKARLLKMILDNEQVRRNERRPNQS
jgi:hypothetical protein